MNTSPPSPKSQKFDPVADLAPYGSITIAKLTGSKPDRVLEGVIAEALRIVKRGRTKPKDTPRASDISPLPRTGLTICGLEWVVERPAASFTDGRRDRQNRYVVAVTDGTYVAFSTNDDAMRTGLLRWTRSPKQGYVATITDRAFRTLADGKVAVAAWLRNTTPHRRAQFQSMAVSAANVGEGAIAADFRSYLAGTVRVVSNVSDRRDEIVTVSPEKSKLSFRRTDRLETWADLVQVSFAWIAHAETQPTTPVFLSGTAEITDSLADVTEPYDVVLAARPPELPSDDEEYLDSLAGDPGRVSFEVPPGQSASDFTCFGLIDGARVGEYRAALTVQGDRWSADFGIVAESDASGGSALSAHVEKYGVEVHFTSEHLYAAGVISHQPMRPIPFRGYDWRDFSESNSLKEKPFGKPKKMRELIGRTDDDSLFGWVVREFPKGWLVCDDGSNETADFINLTDDELNLIAVKAAKSSGGSTSTDAVHLVAAQLSKNLFLGADLELLHHTLNGRKDRLVVFKDGNRQDSPDEFLNTLAVVRPALVGRCMTIVQPQLTRPGVDAAHAAMDEGSRNTKVLSIMRIDELLRTVDARCADHGFKFQLIGSIKP